MSESSEVQAYANKFTESVVSGAPAISAGDNFSPYTSGVPKDYQKGLIAISNRIIPGVYPFTVDQYDKCVKFRLGKYVGTLEPGLRWYIPGIDDITEVDMRITPMDIRTQEVISEDNVTLYVNGVVFYRVESPEKAVLGVSDYKAAVAQLAQSALRDMCGKANLDDILTKREELGRKIKEIVDKETDVWGIDIADVKITDIFLPENMKRAMAKQAEAERERRAKVISAEGEVQAAKKLIEAARTLEGSKVAQNLRAYQALGEITGEGKSTIVFPYPLDLSGISNYLKGEAKASA
ncbi:MAG: slipin family protein [Candidatus Aenigmarchaeota archaeon]|nr:slipin family protein [Candidatus Aenigmarchaeota archaeon]